MSPVRSRAELMDALEQVRRVGRTPLTNWFAAPERIDSWIGRESLSFMQGERAMLILRRDAGFYRVYHFAADFEALAAVLGSPSWEHTANRVLTADLIGRPPDLDRVAMIYRESGFADHNLLVRMIRMATPEEVAASESDVEFARPADVVAVAAFLDRHLDPYTDQIPDEGEIRRAIAHASLILVRRGESVAGLLLFESIGLTSHLRYWYVDDEARNQGIGARLIRRFFRLCSGSKRLILWVVSENADAIAKYRYYGFRPELLVDRIMIRRQ